MLLYPSIDVLKEKVDSRYTLCAMTSKRARDIIAHKPELIAHAEPEKPLSVATMEAAEELISYKR